MLSGHRGSSLQLWHHWTVTRWLILLLLAVFASTAGDADAQAFKPKRSTPVKGAPAKKTAPVAAKKTPGSGPRRVVTSSKATAKNKGAPAATSDDAASDPDEPTSKSTTRDDDYVLIEDDDE